MSCWNDHRLTYQEMYHKKESHSWTYRLRVAYLCRTNRIIIFELILANFSNNITLRNKINRCRRQEQPRTRPHLSFRSHRSRQIRSRSLHMLAGCLTGRLASHLDLVHQDGLVLSALAIYDQGSLLDFAHAQLPTPRPEFRGMVRRWQCSWRLYVLARSFCSQAQRSKLPHWNSAWRAWLSRRLLAP